MMKKVRYRAVWNRKKQLRPDGTGLVQIESYLRRQRMYVSTQIYVTASQWDVAKLLGHKNVRTTMNYCEVADGTIVKELERILDEKGENGRKR